MTVVYSGGRPVPVASSPMAQLREYATEVTRALEDARWENLSTEERRGDASFDERRLTIERSRRFVRRHPLAKQASKLLVNYVLGQGITLRANDKQFVAKIVDEFWDDPVNRAVFTSQRAMSEVLKMIFRDGDMFLVLFPDTEAGTVQLGLLDALFVRDIISDPDNWRVAKWYKVAKPKGEFDFKNGVWNTESTNDFVYYRDWRNTDEDSTGGPEKVEKGLVYHVAINERGLFGEPETAAALDWLKAHKDFMEDRATINRAAAMIAWRKKQKGSVASVQAEAARLRSSLTNTGAGWDSNPPAASGATIVENDGTSMEWVKTDTGGATATNDERILRMMLGSGMGGIPNHIFGDEAQANLATATAMGTPMNKGYEQWQKLLGDVVTDILTFLLDTAHAAGRIGPRDDSSKYDERANNPQKVLNQPEAKPTGQLTAGAQNVKEHGSPDDPNYWKYHPNSAAGRAAAGKQGVPTGEDHPDVKKGVTAPATPSTATGEEDKYRDTDLRYVQPDGKWTPDREALHRQYVAQVQKGAATVAEPTVYMTGGGPASGKSSFLSNAGTYGIPTEGAAYVNADDARKMLPEYQDLIKEGFPGAAAVVQEEASQMSKAALYDSLRNGHNVIYDAVGDNGIDKLEKKIMDMRNAGPGKTRVFADYMTLPVEEAISRAAARAASSASEKGRAVPESIIRTAYHDLPTTVKGAIDRNVFDQLRVWDNSVPKGEAPILLATYTPDDGLQINDAGRWQSFLDGTGTTVKESRVDLREHGDPSMPNYAADYHPGYAAKGAGEKPLSLSSKNGWVEGSITDRGPWTSADGKTSAANPPKDAARIIALHEKAFAKAGGKIHEASGLSDAETALMRVHDMEQAMPQITQWQHGVGTGFTKRALNSARYGERVLIAHDGDGIAGALSFNDSNERFYLDTLGTTGIADGTGSALFATAVRMAAGMNKGISLEPISTAQGFWKIMGTHPLDEPGVWGLSDKEVAELAKGFTDG